MREHRVIPARGTAGGCHEPEIRAMALAGRWLALVAALGVLHLCGRGALARPSLGLLPPGPAGASPRPAIETAVAVIRLAALGAGGYLLFIVTVALIGRSLRHRPTVHLAARFTPPSLRTILALATTTGVAVGVAGPVAGAAGTRQPPAAAPPTLRWTASPAAGPADPPTLRWTASPAAPPATPTSLKSNGPAPAGDAAPPTLHWMAPPTARLAAPPSSTAARPARRAVAEPDQPRKVRAAVAGRSLPTPPRPVRRPTPAPVNPSGYVIRPGDNFWSIAASRVGVSGPGARADNERVADYWRLLVEANRRNLPVPGQPDLLFPGDRIDLPPVS
jgi:hypothetical protein